MHGFSKHENVHFTREIEVENSTKPLRFHEFSCVLDFCKMSKISTWSLVDFGLLLFVEGTSFNATPHFEEWQCFGKINFEEPNCHRLVALPQVSIVVQAVEVLLYLPWTAVYASRLLTVSSVRIFLASPSSFLIIESSFFCQGFFGWWWCGSLGNGLQCGSVVWFRIRDMIRTAQSLQFGCINHSKKVGQFGCWSLSRRRRCWIQRTIITFRPFRHTLLKVKFLSKNSILTKLYNFSREIKVVNN